MCNVPGAKDYLSRAVKSAANPSFNPIKQFKRTATESLDTTGQAMAQEAYDRELASQSSKIALKNQETRNNAPANSYVLANGSFVQNSQRRKRTSLLAEDDNLTLLG